MLVNASSAVEEVYRENWGRILATLIGMFRDFDLAEECAQEAFAAAAEQWPTEGVPENARAWIVQSARHKAIDRIRRGSLYREKLNLYVASGYVRESEDQEHGFDEEIPDDRLRLIFTCCHPALSVEAQVALTLRTLCGLETDEIARAFLLPPATLAQRIVRAKRKIRDAGIPYAVPEAKDLAERLDAVLSVVYLVFNEGYLATKGAALVRTDLCEEAIRLCRAIVPLVQPPLRVDVTALLALMLLHDARRETRFDEAGDLVVLEEQDRSRWNQKQIAEALPLAAEALRQRHSAFALQAGIASVHCRALRAQDTDWRAIVSLYRLLEAVQPTPVVSLNRAVAEAMAEGPQRGLDRIEEIAGIEELEEYHLLHAARADLLRRLGKWDEAASSYRRALELVTNERERRYLESRLGETNRVNRSGPVPG